MTVYVSRVSMPYWRAIPQDERDAIEAAIPAGHHLVIKPGHHGQPGTADVELRDDRNRTVAGPSRGYVSAARCWAVLPRFRVTVAADGYIEDIEDEPA